MSTELFDSPPIKPLAEIGRGSFCRAESWGGGVGDISASCSGESLSERLHAKSGGVLGVVRVTRSDAL